MTLGCLAMLLLAQALIGAQPVGLNRQITDMTADRLEVAARQIGGRIENGMRLGKPLGQYFGLARHLHDSVQGDRAPGGAAVHLLMPQLAAENAPFLACSNCCAPWARRHGVLPKGMTRRRRRAAAPARQRDAGDAARRGVTQGAVILSTQRNTEASRAGQDNLRMLVLVTLVAALGLAVASAASPLRGRCGRRGVSPRPAGPDDRPGRTPVHHPYLSRRLAGRDPGNAQDLAEGLQRDLNRVLSYGVETGRLRGVEAPFDRLIETFPTIASVELADADGQALARRRADAGAGAPAQASELTITLPLGTASAPPQSRGSLIIQLSQAVIASSVLAAPGRGHGDRRGHGRRHRNAAALSLLAGRGPTASAIMQDGCDVRDAARHVRLPVRLGAAAGIPAPVRALAAGRRPVAASQHHDRAAHLRRDGLRLGRVVRGRLSDLKSWRVPVLIGLALSGAGMLACLAAATLPQFILARGLVGLGYGLTWMGLQGLVVSRSPADCRGAT